MPRAWPINSVIPEAAQRLSGISCRGGAEQIPDLRRFAPPSGMTMQLE